MKAMRGRVYDIDFVTTGKGRDRHPKVHIESMVRAGRG